MSDGELTYSESAKGIKINRDRVVLELVRHGVVEEQQSVFFKEVRPPKAGLWKAEDVLSWLGY